MNNQDTRFANQYNIQWFPGHMTKTLRMMEQEIQHVDASLVLLDARIPLSSLNPEIERGARSLLVDLAAIGFGVAGVTEEFVTRDLESGRLRQLKTSFQIPPRSVDMCMLRDVPQTAAAERFAAFVKQSLSKK